MSKARKRSKKTEKQTDNHDDQLIGPSPGQSAGMVAKKSGNVEGPTIPARPVFRMPTSWSSLSPSSSQEAIGSTSTPERNPQNRRSDDLATPDTTPPKNGTNLGYPGPHVASTPVTIVLDDDDDDNDNEELSELPELPAPPPPNLQDSFGDDFEIAISDDFDDDLEDLEDLEDLNLLLQLNHLNHLNDAPEPEPAQDAEDPDLAEAIRLSMLESTNAGKHSNAIIDQTISHEDAELEEPLPKPGRTDSVQASLLLDRRAIAEARLAHLKKARAAASPPQLAGTALSESALESGRQPSSRTLEVIDLTLD